MSNHEIVRRLPFCAGHRVHMHESKCAHPHGHNYIAFIKCVPEEGLDAVGRVVDFSVIKQHVGTWIDQYWDHGFIYWAQDPLSAMMMDAFQQHAGFPPKVFIMEKNPTAENMAEYLFYMAKALLRGTGCVVTSVSIQETENCTATFSP